MRAAASTDRLDPPGCSYSTRTPKVGPSRAFGPTSELSTRLTTPWLPFVMKARKTARRPLRQRLPSRRQRYVFYAVGISVLLIFNIWAANNAFKANRVRVPYSPFFVEQIRAGNVESIISTGT